MRFADLNGSMVDVYQAATQMTDESGQSEPANIDSLLNKALGPEGYYGVFTANMHTDSASSSGSDAIVASAQSHNVPVVSARQMLTWLDGRNNSSFGGVTWNGNTLDFTIAPFSGSNGLRAMVPTSSSVGQLTGVTRNGSPVPTTARTIKGTEYAFIDGTAGSYEATYAVDNTAPAISNVSASAPGDGTANVTWDTNEASDSRVDYGTSPGSLGSHQSSPGLTTSHSIQLTGLAPNTTFYYRVVSTDAATNSATDPDPPAAPRSFTTPSASFTDTTVSDFGAGTPDANTYISEMSNGEVTLKPAEGQEFSGGPGLPAGWASQTWESQGGGAGGTRHGLRRCPARGRRLRRHQRDLRRRPLARFRGDLRRGHLPARGVHGQLHQRLGDVQHPGKHQPAVHEHQHRRWSHRHPDRRPVHRLGAQVPDPVGRGPGAVLRRWHPGPHRQRHLRTKPERRGQ